jgi:hypothetical protein
VSLWRRPAGVWVAIATASACGTSSTSSPTDAGTETPDANGPTAPDATAADGASEDAGADASFCEMSGPGHDFCEDFDRPLVMSGENGFDRAQVGDEGARLVQENGVLRGEILYLDSGALGFSPGILWLERPWARLGDGSKPRLVVRHRLRVEQCPAAGVASLGMLGGSDLHGFGGYFYSVSALAYLDVECKLVLRAYVDNDVDGAPKPNVTLFSKGLPIATKQWIDVTFELKEAANNQVHVSLRVGGAEAALDFEARSQASVVALSFGVLKNEFANVSALFLLDNLLADYTKP